MAFHFAKPSEFSFKAGQAADPAFGDAAAAQQLSSKTRDDAVIRSSRVAPPHFLPARKL